MSNKIFIPITVILAIALLILSISNTRNKEKVRELEKNGQLLYIQKKLDSLDIENNFLYTFVQQVDSLKRKEIIYREKISIKYEPIFKNISVSDSQFNITMQLLAIHRQLDAKRD